MKITLSLSGDLVKRIEKRRKRGLSRSAIFEQMLEESERAARQRALDEEVRAYYAEGDPEADALSRWMSKAVKKLEFDAEPKARRKR